jgi:hypothetical protein
MKDALKYIPHCLSFLAIILALLKETSVTNKEDSHANKTTLNRLGQMVLLLGIAGFGVSSLITYNENADKRDEGAKKEADKQVQSKINDYIKNALDAAAPDSLQKAIDGSQGVLNKSFQEAITASTGSLQGTINQVTTNSSQKVKEDLAKAIAGSGTELKSRTDAAKAAITASVGAAQTAISNSINAASTETKEKFDENNTKIQSLSAVVGEFPGKIQVGVNTAVNGSVGLITDKTKASIEEQTRNIAQSVATEITQIPFTLEQRTIKRRLPGLLSDLFITVGDITTKEVCKIDITDDANKSFGTLQINLKDHKNDKQKVLYTVKIKHKTGTYSCEVFAVTQRVVNDYLVVRIVKVINGS